MMTNDLLECVPESTIDNPTLRESFKKIIESIKRASRKVSEVVDFSTLSKNWTRNGNYDVETTLNLFLKMRNQLENKVSSLSNKSFDPSKCRINRVTETSGREILEMTIENGETILMYKSTGLAGKKLPPPGGWSVIPGFISEAKLVGSNNISLWFGKDDITIGLTHTDINGNGTNKYLSELAQYLQKNSPSKLILK
jgi:hypothetical protein